MNDRDARALILENARLRKNQLPHCRGCEDPRMHDCGAFHFCHRLGAVDPDTDGCSRRKEAGR